VLLIHHALGSSRLYSDPRLGSVSEWVAARGCRVISYDLPGHGRSDPLNAIEEDFVERCAVDAMGVLEACGVGHAAAVIGVGFGGLVALRIGAMLPKSANCVIADSAPGLLPSAPWEPWPGLMEPSDDEQVSIALEHAWSRYAISMAERDPYEQLAGNMQCPSLLVFSSGGEARSTQKLYATARALGSQVALVPGDAPPTCWRSPSFFVREVEKFLASFA
jgi:pimeloyl-ACP methyl ester carboxylesterase